ncbi:MAG: sigma 54-interacting transcriptional regulator [Deltaproteobacteria bacterium]
MLPQPLPMPEETEKTKTLLKAPLCHPPQEAELILYDRDHKESQFPLTQGMITIGSSVQNDVVIKDPYVSSTHCLIEKREGLYFLMDRKSRNGTFLNKIMIRETSLGDQATIQIGKTTLQFRYKEKSKSGISPLFEGMVSQSILMQHVFELVEKVALSKTTVMIYGETGTGKELIAKALHGRSDRKKKPFVVVNCGAIPKELLESELFGHVKGAFTGACENRPGSFQSAEGGTLFLDEIGEFPVELQPKLLRALEQREIKSVGSEWHQKIDVRIVAATHRNLAQMVKSGHFREDLFYRLHLIPIYLPPLRDRKEDIPLLAKHFLENTDISSGALKLLLQYAWPGNIREFKNILERVKLLKNGPLITEKDIRACLRTIPVSFSETIHEMEKNIIYEFLERNQWNRTATARALSLPKSTLLGKIRKYNLRRQKKINKKQIDS